MRKYLIAALAACTTAAGATAALAQEGSQPAASVKATISPKKAGSKKHPANSKLKLSVVNSDTTRTMSKLTVFLPAKLKASGAGFKACSDDEIQAGKKKCKPLGGGVALAAAGVSHQDVATGQWVRNDNPLTLGFKVTPFVQGKTKLGFHLQQLKNDSSGKPTKELQPSGIDLVAHSKLKKAGKPYGQKLVLTVPDQAKQYPTGSFNGLISLTTTLGGKSGSHKLLVTTGCAKKVHPFKVALTFMDNHISPAGTVTATGTSKCS